jgi:galactokinase/mevalonate kinase-like predicted kinase/histidinol phosphatase-like enzyme
VQVDIESEAPPGSGLGGSSALVTAVVAALAMLQERAMTRTELRADVLRDRTRRPRISGGWQDQYAAAFGGCNLIEFRSTGVRVTPVASEPARLEDLRRNLCSAIRGKVRRNVGLIDTQIDLFRSGREETLLGMKQLVEMAYAMRGVIEAGDLERLGQMLHDAFEAKKRMNPHIADHTPIEAMLDAARDAGASGGKICGAGGGGYLLIACTPDVRAAVRSALESMGGQFAPFDFDRDGVRAMRGDGSGPPPPRERGPPVRAARPRRDDQHRGRPPVRSRRTGVDPRLGRGDPRLREDLGLGIVVVTNQANVGRGLLSTGQLDAIHDHLRSMLAAEGVAVDAILVCPHAPRTTARAANRDRAWPSRQPSGSASIAAEAFVVGDHAGDVGMGRAIGATTFLVMTGHGPAEAERAREDADHVVPDLAAAVDIIARLVSGERTSHRPREGTT